MLRPFMENVRHRVGTPVATAASFAVLIWLGTQGAHEWQVSPAVRTLSSLGDGVVSGVFVTGAICAAVVTWRRHASPLTGWIVATGALVAAQALLVTTLALQGRQSGDPAAGQALLLAAATAGLVAVVVPLLRLDQVRHVVDDGFAIGLGMGVVAAGHVLLQLPAPAPGATSLPALAEAIVGVVVLTHVAAVLLVLRQHALSPSLALLLLTTVAVVGVGLVIHLWGSAGTVELTLVAVARAATGAAWLGIGWASLQRDAVVDDELEARMTAEIDLAVQAGSRDQSERLHELRSTVAGLVNGSALLDNADIPDEARRHLCESVHRELQRMQRLLAGEHGSTTDLDLDETLHLILDLQRLKGRHVELHTSGGTVRARYDSLAEVVNILMDNAATHGGCDHSLVEVVRRDEETVDITVSDNGRGIPEDQRARIFDWGNRGVDSPGQGIGLHVAQRLMAEDGGTLRLAEARGPGSAFVISLPSARRSPENHIPREDSHGAWRIPG
ncbi:hypothetical protein GCM10009641_43580 [Mycobacterium cookii]|uniref:Sensor-like histidine kinase SenX3 n=2 Tax=Nocardioides furvisabuli TaxID=375542 RepID=A0ABP5JFK2_9ACTN